MSLKKVGQVKRDKLFRPADLIIYGLVVAVSAILFAVVFAVRDGKSLNGIRIYVRYEIVFEYDFEEDRYEIFGGGVEVLEGEDFFVKITTPEGFNTVRIDRSARIVTVVDADCRSRDCVHTPEISDNDGLIFCSPHRVLIEPFNRKSDNGTILM